MLPVLACAGGLPGWAVSGVRAWNPALVFPDDAALVPVVAPLLAVATGTPRIPVHWLHGLLAGPGFAFIMGSPGRKPLLAVKGFQTWKPGLELPVDVLSLLLVAVVPHLLEVPTGILGILLQEGRTGAVPELSRAPFQGWIPEPVFSGGVLLVLGAVVVPLLLAAVLTGMLGVFIQWPQGGSAGAVPVLSCAPFQGWIPAVVFPAEMLLLVVVPPLLLATVLAGMLGMLVHWPQEACGGTVALSCARSAQKSPHCWA